MKRYIFISILFIVINIQGGEFAPPEVPQQQLTPKQTKNINKEIAALKAEIELFQKQLDDLYHIRFHILGANKKELNKQIKELINKRENLEQELNQKKAILVDPSAYLEMLKKQQLAHRKKYEQRPEVKERRKKYKKEYQQRPEIKKRRLEYKREYRQREEAKEKIRKYQKEYQKRPETKEKLHEYMKEYRQREEVKERRRERIAKEKKKQEDDFIESFLA